MRYKVNDRVRVLYSEELAVAKGEDIAKMFVGERATIVEVDSTWKENPYTLKFDKESLNSLRIELWHDEELEKVEENKGLTVSVSVTDTEVFTELISLSLWMFRRLDKEYQEAAYKDFHRTFGKDFDLTELDDLRKGGIVE